jgi:hypothetical protein
MTFRGSSLVSSFNCRSKILRLSNTTLLEIPNCKEILKIYANSLSSEIYCIVDFFEKDGRMRTKRELAGG